MEDRTDNSQIQKVWKYMAVAKLAHESALTSKASERREHANRAMKYMRRAARHLKESPRELWRLAMEQQGEYSPALFKPILTITEDGAAPALVGGAPNESAIHNAEKLYKENKFAEAMEVLRAFKNTFPPLPDKNISKEQLTRELKSAETIQKNWQKNKKWEGNFEEQYAREKEIKDTLFEKGGNVDMNDFQLEDDMASILAYLRSDDGKIVVTGKKDGYEWVYRDNQWCVLFRDVKQPEFKKSQQNFSSVKRPVTIVRFKQRSMKPRVLV